MCCRCQLLHDIVQSSVKAVLPGFGKSGLEYCAIVHFLGGQRKHFEDDYQNLAGMFLHNSVNGAVSRLASQHFSSLLEKNAILYRVNNATTYPSHIIFLECSIISDNH